jgi:hypothetical protein
MILELEREQNDLLIVAHESVLRVLYGYLMACDAMSIPSLKFPRDEIIEASCICHMRNTFNKLTMLRSYRHHTKTKLSASRSLALLHRSFQALLRTSAYLFHPVASHPAAFSAQRMALVLLLSRSKALLRSTLSLGTRAGCLHDYYCVYFLTRLFHLHGIDIV